ncbi:MAG: hypothetical protein ABUS47_14260 [Steroidobacter sp.]
MKYQNSLLTFILAGMALVQTASADDNIADKAINQPRISGIMVYGSAQTNNEVKDKAVLGEKAKRIEAKGTGNPWDAAAQTTTTGKILTGDPIVCVAFLKAVKTANNAPAKVTLRFQESAAPYTEIKQDTIDIGTDWNQYQISVTANKDYGAGDTAFVVQLNYGAQTVDVGPMFILNMNKTKPGSR